MTKEELVAKLRDIEWEDFEVKAAKSELPKNVWESVSAFSNTSGGWIVLGVKQSGKTFEIQGVDNIEKLEQDSLGTLRGEKFNQRLKATPKRYEIDGKKLLAFYIPEVDFKPVYYNNPLNTFIRMGSGDQRATEGEIRAMFRDQSFGKKTEETIPDTSIEMLNLNTLKSYRFALGQTQNLINLRDVDDAEFCEQVNITRNGLLTYAGLLMFGKSPYVLRYVPTFCVDYIEIPGPTIQQAEVRYTYRIPEQDNIWEAVQIILRRFRTLVDAPIHIKDDGFATHDDSQYKVLREALANMVMHCDHFDSLRSCIRVYTDHIEFMNGGAFPLPVKDILGRIYSKLRNPTIAKLFRFVGIAENAGYGMNKLASWETLTGTTPTIESDRTLAVVSFPLRSAIQRIAETSPVAENGANVPVNVGNVGKNSADEGEIGAENVGKDENEGNNVPANVPVNSTVNVPVNSTVNVPVNSTVNVPVNSTVNVPVNSTVNSTVKLTDLQKSILNLMTDKAEITIDEISAAIGRDRNAVNYQLKKLRVRGLIERVGSDKTGKWTVNIAP